MKQKKNLMILIVLLFSSCDDRVKSLNVLNTAPKLEYYNSSNKLVENITDSVRLLPSGITVYNLKLKLIDYNKNIQFLNLVETKGEYKTFYQKSEIFAPSSFRTDVEKLILNLYPTNLGIISATFKITDRFGLSTKSDVNLYVFDNITPLAILKVNKKQGNEFILDASTSYDRDRNFGGKIVEYKFKINGIIQNSDLPVINQILPQGESTIQLSVLDNSKTLSETVELKINNNPN